jgi:hypothetical protein
VISPFIDVVTLRSREARALLTGRRGGCHANCRCAERRGGSFNSELRALGRDRELRWRRPVDPRLGAGDEPVATTSEPLITATATASSVQAAGFEAAKAVDGNLTTRWSSKFDDAEWIYVDLGSAQPFDDVKLYWENAYAATYSLQVSNDATHWTTLKNVTTASGIGGARFELRATTGRLADRARVRSNRASCIASKRAAHLIAPNSLVERLPPMV